jgi:phosphate:Na+ symporter
MIPPRRIAGRFGGIRGSRGTDLGIGDYAGLIGGIGLFLIGMNMMTEGLKLSAGASLRTILSHFTSTRLRALAAGFSITALAQSSSAVTVATIGFVNAGLLTLPQAVWVVFGSNVGTTTTSWLISLVGVNLKIEALALPAIGVGALMRLAGRDQRFVAIGQALAGFGLFFLGIAILRETFGAVATQIDVSNLATGGFANDLVFVGIGFLLTLLTQSSSASIAIAITAAAGGLFGLETAAAMVIGANLGTTSTAALAVIGATSNAKRVALAHVLFNVIVGVVAMASLPVLLAIVSALGAELDVPGQTATATMIAIFHSLVKLLGVLLIWPIAGALVAWLETRFRSAEEDEGRPRHLDPNALEVPSLAVESLTMELRRLGEIATGAARTALTNDQPASGRANLAARLSALDSLSVAIRSFIGRVQTGPIGPALVAAVPHALRIVQHYQAIGAAVPLLDASLRQGPPIRAELAASLTAYRTDVAASLHLPEPPEAREGPDSPQAIAARIEAGYQRIKTELLVAAARGEVEPMTLDRLIMQLDRIRRCGEHAAKARQRFQRIEDALAGRVAWNANDVNGLSES